MGKRQLGLNEQDEILDVRDPALDAATFRQAVVTNLEQRRAAGAYGDDLASVVRTIFGEEIALDEVMGDPATLPDLVAELATSWALRERPFVSRVPVFGRLVVAVRNAWNWMSTKWYVRPLLQQQMAFNVLAARAIADLLATQAELSERLRAVEAENKRREEGTEQEATP